jgi:hypothetical protein
MHNNLIQNILDNHNVASSEKYDEADCSAGKKKSKKQ